MSTSAYTGVAKWAGRDEWRERFDFLLDDHLDATWDHLGVETQDELVELLGEDRFALAYSAAFEDLLSRVWDDGSNLANDYLKRRGFKETATTRDRLASYPGSVRRVWRVVDVQNDGAVLIEDVICGGEPQWVEAAPATEALEKGVCFAARVLHARRGLRLGMCFLPFSTVPGVVSAIRAQITEFVEGEGLAPVEAAERALFDGAGLLTTEWLADGLDDDGAPESDEEFAEDEKADTFSVRWPVAPGVSDIEIRAAFRGTSAMRVFVEGAWFLVDETLLDETDDSSVALVGPVMLKDGEIVLVALTYERAEHGLSLLSPVLEGLVGAPLIRADAALSDSD